MTIEIWAKISGELAQARRRIARSNTWSGPRHDHLRRSWFRRAAPPDGRHERPHHQPARRNHRIPDHVSPTKKVSRRSNTSSRRTAHEKVLPTPRSTRRAPVTSRAVSSMSRTTSSFLKKTAAPKKASSSTSGQRKYRRLICRPRLRPRSREEALGIFKRGTHSLNRDDAKQSKTIRHHQRSDRPLSDDLQSRTRRLSEMLRRRPLERRTHRPR
jgi:hypothetical protein